MEIGPSTMAAREIAINKENVGSDILQKTLQESKELEQLESSKPVEQVNREKQGMIDLYA